MKKHDDFVDQLTVFSLRQRWKSVYPPVKSYIRAKITEGYNRANLWQHELLLEESKRNTFAHQAVAYKVLLDFLDEMDRVDDL